jgi:DNA-binding CsgD family transcriptional regulator
MRSLPVNTHSLNTTFSNHYGVSNENPDISRIKKMLASYRALPGTVIYSQVFTSELCVLRPFQENILGFRASCFNIHRLIDMVHPQDREKAWRLTKKAFEVIFSKQTNKEFVYRITYRIRPTGGQYVRILRETVPFCWDARGKMICSMSRITDISHMGNHHGVRGWLTYPNKVINLTPSTTKHLTKRELEILHYLAGGFTSKCIGNHLCISKLTVDKHRANMLQKTHTRNTSELISYAIEHGWIE